MRETENTEENVFSGIGRSITWIYFGWKWKVLFGHIYESKNLKAHLCTAELCTQGPSLRLKAGQTGCTQTPYWGHPLCGHKASFSSLSGQHSSCQPAVGAHFRAEDWRCDLQWGSWSPLGWGGGLLKPPWPLQPWVWSTPCVLERAVVNDGACRDLHRPCLAPTALQSSVLAAMCH